MSFNVHHLVSRLWPPCEAWVVDRRLNQRKQGIGDDARWESILTEVRTALPRHAGYKSLEIIAKEIRKSETKRKETLDEKASLFVAATGVALSIGVLAASLFPDKQGAEPWVVPLGVLYLLTLIHLFSAVYYALIARRITALASLSADTFMDCLKHRQWGRRDRIILAIAQARWNEDVLLRKVNYLSVAEDLFVRGLFLISSVVVLNILIRLMTGNAPVP